MEYVEFRIRVKDTKNISAWREKSAPVEAFVQYDTLRAQTIRVLSRLIARDDTRIEELEVLGSHLYGVLFGGEVGKEFQDAYRQKGHATLRVVLEFLPAAQNLASLPWEYLYVPNDASGKGFFIAVQNRLILSRHVPLTGNEQDALTPQGTPLRVLLVVSQPQYELVRAVREGEWVEELMAMGTVEATPVIDMVESLASQSEGRIEVTRLEQPTKKKFADMLKDKHPHIVHFIGHGRYEKGGVGALALIKATGQKSEAFWLNDSAFTDCFSDVTPPRLVFLHACEGARTDSYEAFSGVALQLVYSRMPAVVAMQYPIKNTAAITFARCLYAALSEGCPIDEAVQRGRNALKMNLEEQEISDPSFGIPVVFLQSKDARSLQGIVIAERVTPALPPSTNKRTYPCPNAECNERVYPDRRFCSACGTQNKLCPNCGEVIGAGSNVSFCPYCGVHVAAATAAGPSKAVAAPAGRPGDF